MKDTMHIAMPPGEPYASIPARSGVTAATTTTTTAISPSPATTTSTEIPKTMLSPLYSAPPSLPPGLRLEEESETGAILRAIRYADFHHQFCDELERVLLAQERQEEWEALQVKRRAELRLRGVCSPQPPRKRKRSSALSSPTAQETSATSNGFDQAATGESLSEEEDRLGLSWYRRLSSSPPVSR